jgi:hypothetical protein
MRTVHLISLLLVVAFAYCYRYDLYDRDYDYFPRVRSIYSRSYHDDTRTLANTLENQPTDGIVAAQFTKLVYLENPPRISGWARRLNLKRAKIWVNPLSKTIVLAYRGTKTSSRTDVTYDIQSQTLVNFSFDVKNRKESCGSVGIGFNAHFFESLSEVKPLLEPLMKVGQGYRLLITGHSLGGAAAHLATAYFSKLFFNVASQISLVTFASPKPGSISFATCFRNTVFNPTLRYITTWNQNANRDYVTLVPVGNYQSVGGEKTFVPCASTGIPCHKMSAYLQGLGIDMDLSGPSYVLRVQ